MKRLTEDDLLHRAAFKTTVDEIIFLARLPRNAENDEQLAAFVLKHFRTAAYKIRVPNVTLADRGHGQIMDQLESTVASRISKLVAESIKFSETDDGPHNTVFDFRCEVLL